MQKKLLIPILVVLVLVIVLMVRGCGNKDASQGDKQDETQDVQTDTFDNTNATGNDVRTELGTMTANESGGVDITVTADGVLRAPLPAGDMSHPTRGTPTRSTMLSPPA